MLKRILLSGILLPILLAGCSSNDEVKGIKPESGDVIKDLGPEWYMGDDAQFNCTKKSVKNPEFINQFLNVDEYIKEMEKDPIGRGFRDWTRAQFEEWFDMYCLDE